MYDSKSLVLKIIYRKKINYSNNKKIQIKIKKSKKNEKLKNFHIVKARGEQYLVKCLIKIYGFKYTG